MSMASEATPVDVHDLNNMLAAIMISATILEREDGASEIRRRHAGHILRATEGAVRLLGGLGAKPVTPQVALPKAPDPVQARDAAKAPALSASGPIAAKAPARVVVPIGGAPLQGISMLLVEDEPTLAAVLDNWLTRRGATVYHAGDISGALAVLRNTGACDVILSDYHLPDGTGLDLARHLARTQDCTAQNARRAGVRPPQPDGISMRRSPPSGPSRVWRRSKIPVCLMSAGPLPAEASPGPDSAVALSVSKPLNLTELAQRLRTVALGDGIFACAS